MTTTTLDQAPRYAANLLQIWRERVEANECPLGCGLPLIEREEDPDIGTCPNCEAKEDYCPVPYCGGLLEGFPEEDQMQCCYCEWPKTRSEDLVA